MPGNCPEENIQHTEHGESLKSRNIYLIIFIQINYVFRYSHFVNIITFYPKKSDVFIIICTKEYDKAVVTYQISISYTVDGFN